MQTGRTHRIAQLVAEGLSYEQIAQYFQLTAERIRQLHRQHLAHDPSADEAHQRRLKASSRFRELQTQAFRAFASGETAKTLRLLEQLASVARRNIMPKPQQKRRPKPRPTLDFLLKWNTEKTQYPPDTQFVDTGMDARALNALNSASIYTIGDVHSLGPRWQSKLLKIKGLGRKSLVGIAEIVYGPPVNR